MQYAIVKESKACPQSSMPVYHMTLALYGPKIGFAPGQGRHVSLINVKFERLPNFTFIGAEMWVTLRIWNFAYKIAPDGRIISTIL